MEYLLIIWQGQGGEVIRFIKIFTVFNVMANPKGRLTFFWQRSNVNLLK
jgi:hypothetical protein